MKIALAPHSAALLGGCAALAVVATPGHLLEALVMDSGLPAVLAPAEPPLGFTARALLALASGALVAGVAWVVASLVLGTRSIALARAPAESFFADDRPMPVIRRADAHPDAPPRPPLLATRDLGTPFLEIGAPAPATEPDAPAAPIAPPERPLPRDLDAPLAAFDPAAIPESPLPPPVTLPLRRKPRPPVFETGERFEVFELTPPVRAQPATPPAARTDPIARSQTEASVHALLDRLERGVARSGLRPKPEPAPRGAERGLEEALVTLRNLARRA